MLRRLGAARGLLAGVIVSVATATTVFAYATTLAVSLSRTASEKAFVANGSDVQALVDPADRILTPFRFPATIVHIDESGTSDVIAGDPAALARVIRWGRWPDDPRRLLPDLLRRAPNAVLLAIASPGFPHVSSIVDNGRRLRIQIVGRAPIPGMTAGRPALLVSARSLLRLHGTLGDSAFIWAKGDPGIVEPALAASNLAPTFMTTVDHVRSDPAVSAAERTYRYFRAIGAGALALALAALLLYLQARRRSQVIASALARRMGLGTPTDAAAVAAEAVAIVALSVLVGIMLAAVAAGLVLPHIDPLPQYAPGTTVVVPWTTFGLVLLASLAVVSACATLFVVMARRSNVAEELRVV